MIFRSSVGLAAVSGSITVSVDGSPSAVPVDLYSCNYLSDVIFILVTGPNDVTYMNSTDLQTIRTMNTTDIIMITYNGFMILLVHFRMETLLLHM